MGTTFLNILSVISTNDCCTLLLTCLEKVFHYGSATFSTDNFKCMVRLKKFSVQKLQVLDVFNPLSTNIFKIYNKHDLYTQLLQKLHIFNINEIIFENMQFLIFVLINNKIF